MFYLFLDSSVVFCMLINFEKVQYFRKTDFFKSFEMLNLKE